MAVRILPLEEHRRRSLPRLLVSVVLLTLLIGGAVAALVLRNPPREAGLEGEAPTTSEAAPVPLRETEVGPLPGLVVLHGELPADVRKVLQPRAIAPAGDVALALALPTTASGTGSRKVWTQPYRTAAGRVCVAGYTVSRLPDRDPSLALSFCPAAQGLEIHKNDAGDLRLYDGLAPPGTDAIRLRTGDGAAVVTALTAEDTPLGRVFVVEAPARRVVEVQALRDGAVIAAAAAPDASLPITVNAVGPEGLEALDEVVPPAARALLTEDRYGPEGPVRMAAAYPSADPDDGGRIVWTQPYAAPDARVCVQSFTVSALPDRDPRLRGAICAVGAARGLILSSPGDFSRPPLVEGLAPPGTDTIRIFADGEARVIRPTTGATALGRLFVLDGRPSYSRIDALGTDGAVLASLEFASPGGPRFPDGPAGRWMAVFESTPPEVVPETALTALRSYLPRPGDRARVRQLLPPAADGFPGAWGVPTPDGEAVCVTGPWSAGCLDTFEGKPTAVVAGRTYRSNPPPGPVTLLWGLVPNFVRSVEVELADGTRRPAVMGRNAFRWQTAVESDEPVALLLTMPDLSEQRQALPPAEPRSVHAGLSAQP